MLLHERLPDQFKSPVLNSQLTAAPPDISYLSSRDDRWLISLPVVFLIFVAVESFYTVGRTGLFTQDVLGFVFRDILFFNSLHVPISFVSFFLLPEFQTWSKQTKRRYFRSFTFELGCTFIFFFAICYLGKILEPSSSAAIVYLLLFSWFQSTYRFTHVSGQVRGLSSLLNRKVLDHFPEAQPVVHLERKLFNSFILLCILSRTFLLLVSAMKNHPWAGAMSSLGTFFFYFSLVGMVLVFLNAFRFPKRVIIKKNLFHLRLLFYPFYFVSPWMAFFSSANHGLESIFTMRKLHRHSKASKQRKQLIVVCSLLSIGVWLGIVVHNYKSIFRSDFSQDAVFILLAAGMATEFLHRRLEGVIYRMKEPAVRENQGRLLAI